MTDAPQLDLPSAPSHLTGTVKAWSEPLSLASTLEGAPDGRPQHVLHIENEFLRLMIGPELDGRIILALDKVTGNELFRRVGAIDSEAGGLRFVWPRSASRGNLRPASTKIEEHLDGSRTVWCSRYDALTRMKGMHGICLHPGRSSFQVKVRLYNQTSLTQRYVWQWKAAPGKGNGLWVVHVAGEQTVDQTGSAFLAPYEMRSFDEYWYGIAVSDPAEPIASNSDVTVTLSGDREIVRTAVYVTRSFPGLSIRLLHGRVILAQWSRDVDPRTPFLEQFMLPGGISKAELSVVVVTQKSRELIRLQSGRTRELDESQVPPAIRPPQKSRTIQELYLTGLYLDAQDPGDLRPQDYWQEALRRDPDDIRSNNALGLWHLRRGEFAAAEKHFHRASVALTSRNPNPHDTEPLYYLGLTLRYLNRDDEAYAWLKKACASYAWQSASYFALAQIDVTQSRPEIALDHLRQAIRVNTEHLAARNLTGAILRRFGAASETNRLIAENLALDPLDGWSHFAGGQPVPGGNQVRLDVAFGLAHAALIEEAIAVLKESDRDADDGSVPVVQYTLGDLYGRMGRYFEAHQHYAAAAHTPVGRCAPYALAELQILERAVHVNERDATAPYLLGVLLYAHGRCEEAIESWETAAYRDPTFPAVWRRLGDAQLNILANPDLARKAYDRAWELDPSDAQTFYRRDQAWQLTGATSPERLAEFESQNQLVRSREDLVLVLVTLYNQASRQEDALAVLETRSEQGQLAEARVETLLLLGQRGLRDGLTPEARAHFKAAFDIAARLGWERTEPLYWLGEAARNLGHEEAAGEYWKDAARLSQTPTYYGALALDRLGYRFESRSVLRKIVDQAREVLGRGDKVNGTFLEAQARVGLGQLDRARRLLGIVLSHHPNHVKAGHLLRSISSPAKYS